MRGIPSTLAASLAAILALSAPAQIVLYYGPAFCQPNQDDYIVENCLGPVFAGDWSSFTGRPIVVNWGNSTGQFTVIKSGSGYTISDIPGYAGTIPLPYSEVLTGSGIGTGYRYRGKSGTLAASDIGTFGTARVVGSTPYVTAQGLTCQEQGQTVSHGSYDFFILLVAGAVYPDGVNAGCQYVGDPIGVLNGNVSIRETDIAIPTPGPPLLWTRAYNSVTNPGTSLGPNWLHTYDWRITRQTNVAFVTTNVLATLRTDTGSEFTFIKTTSGLWTAQADCSGLLTETAGAFTHRTPDNFLYSFDTNGVLLGISDDWGNALVCVYTNNFPTQRLVSVNHTCGLSLGVEYSNGAIARVTTVATNLVVDFAHNESGELTNATVNTGSDLRRIAYCYAPTSVSVAHCITQRVDAAGFASNWRYETNASGFVTSRGIGGYVGTNAHLAVSLSPNGTNAHQTVVSYPNLGVTNTFLYSTTPEIARIARISGPNDVGPTQHNTGITLAFNDRLNLTDINLRETGSTATGGVARLKIQYESTGVFPTNLSADFFTSTTNLSAPRWAFEWDTNAMVLTKARDPEGILIEAGYTNRAPNYIRRFLSGTNIAETRISYTTNGLIAGITNANGAGVALTYDAYGFVNGVTPLMGPVVVISNDTLGRPLYIERPGGRTVTLERDGAGLVRHANYSGVQEEAFALDGKGLLTNHVDVAGRTNLFIYEFGGRLASVTRLLPAGGSASVTVDYDQQLNVRRVSDELGRAVESYGRDSYDRVVAVTNLEGQAMTIEYAVLDLVRTVTRFDGTVVSNSFDTKGNLTSVSYPGVSSTFDWYQNGFLRYAANEAGTVSNVMDAAGRLESARSAAPSGLVSYTYYPVGNVSGVVSVAGTTKYAKDAADRVTGIDGPTADASITYNSENGLIDTLAYSNGVTATYSWDVLDRLTGIRWVKGTSELRRLDYGYNPANLITGIVREAGRKIGYRYDDLDRLTFERLTLPNGGTGYEAEYSYDLAGNRTSKRRDGVNVSYTNGTGNRLLGWSVTGSVGSLTVPVTGYSSETIGTNELFGYLAVIGSATSRPAVAGTNFWVEHLPVAAGTQQVVAAIRDAAGNMGYDTNTLTVLMTTNAAYGYNAAGCVTSISYQSAGGGQVPWVLEWNGRYELTGVRSNGTVIETYTYDALGRRASVAAGGTTNYFVYDGPHVVADVNATGGLVRSYLYGPGIDNILAMTVHSATNQTYYYLKDHLGSVLGLTDQSGNLVESYEYDAWGRPSFFDSFGRCASASVFGNRYLFQGREYSKYTGLHYFRARWADSISGRWVAPDPLGLLGGLNLYSFCFSAPTIVLDPFGTDNLSGNNAQVWGMNVSQNAIASTFSYSPGSGNFSISGGQLQGMVNTVVGGSAILGTGAVLARGAVFVAPHIAAAGVLAATRANDAVLRFMTSMPGRLIDPFCNTTSLVGGGQNARFVSSPVPHTLMIGPMISRVTPYAAQVVAGYYPGAPDFDMATLTFGMAGSYGRGWIDISIHGILYAAGNYNSPYSP